MNILLLTHTMPRFKADTNSASFISELAESLAKQGHNIIVLTPYDILFKNYKRSFKVIPYKYIWPLALHKSGYSRVLENKKMKPNMYIFSTLMSLSALIHMIWLTKKYKIDVVTAHWAVPNGFIAYLANFITRVPYTITIPGSDVYLASKRKFFRLTTKFAALGADYVLSDSQHYLDQLNTLEIYPKKTKVIRYGVDTNFLKSTKKPSELLKNLHISKDAKVILALGRFVEKKGFVYLIEALPKIIKYNKNVKLVLVGDGELRVSFEKLVKRLKIEENVIFTGAVAYSHRNKYYNLADIFVMPSVKDSEGNIDASPVAMMDAMACGVPVIATKYSGSPDLIINGKTGWMVKEKSSQDISNSIINLLKQNENLAKDVREVALSNFSLESTAKKYIEVFKEVISSCL